MSVLGEKYLYRRLTCIVGATGLNEGVEHVGQ